MGKATVWEAGVDSRAMRGAAFSSLVIDNVTCAKAKPWLVKLLANTEISA